MQEHAPALSVLLVVRREQAWLEEAAASVLADETVAVELVAVDDGADDHAPELLDELARRDARVRVEHLPEPLGPAAARERAVALARAPYVWFLRPTDLVAPGALARIVARVGETDPDVLLVHHVRRGVLGAERPGPARRTLKRIAGDGAELLDDPGAASRLGPSLGAQVVRSAHAAALAAPSAGRGGDEELALAWPVLLTARRVDALAEVCWVRRDIPRAPDRSSALDLPAAYDRVLAFAGGRDDVPARRREGLAAAAMRHQLRVLADLSGPDRRRFFAELAEQQRRHGGHVTAPVEARAVERGAWPAYEALRAARRTRAAASRERARVRRRGAKAKAAWTRRRLELYYRARLREPIDPDLAVFAAYWYRGYSCNPRAIYEKARELVPGLRGVWVVTRRHAAEFPVEVPHVIAGTPEYYDLVARARYFVNNVNFPNDLVKRPGTIHVMTHHGTPLKLMGLDERRSPVTKMDFAALLRRCSRWDFSVSSNAHSTLVWERVYPTRYESLEVGYPRNDVLATATDADVERARRALGLEPWQVAVLYAPTHREHQKRLILQMDVDAVAAGLGPEHVLLVRGHYFYAPGADAPSSPKVRDVATYPSIEELCLAADVLVTDYSSIMFDFAILDRPIVVHAPDWEAYQAIRGTYFDIREQAPGVATRTEDELVEAFRSGAVAGDEARRRRAIFRERFCSLEDGRAAERVVRRVWLGERVQPPRAVALAQGS